MDTSENLSSELVALARDIAVQAHAGQVDKAGADYISHPERVAARVAPHGPAFEATAWLHDVLEDSEVTASDLITRGIPRDVVEGVQSVTKRSGEPHAQAVERAAQNSLGLVVKAADVADNSDPQRLRLLPETMQEKLTVKYRIARELLDAHSAPTFD